MWSNEALNQNNKKFQIDFFSSSTNKNRLLTPTKSNSKQLQNANDYLTPSMMNLCKLLDDELSRLLNDIEFSTNESKNQSNDSILSDDLRHFNEYLLANLKSFSQTLCDSLNNLINKLYQELKNESTDQNVQFHIRKILFICRLAHALPKSSSNLFYCFNTFELNQNKPKIESLLSKKRLIQTDKKNDENWQHLLDKLRKLCKHGFK
jgi:hypothetical protein